MEAPHRICRQFRRCPAKSSAETQPIRCQAACMFLTMLSRQKNQTTDPNLASAQSCCMARHESADISQKQDMLQMHDRWKKTKSHDQLCFIKPKKQLDSIKLSVRHCEHTFTSNNNVVQKLENTRPETLYQAQNTNGTTLNCLENTARTFSLTTTASFES